MKICLAIFVFFIASKVTAQVDSSQVTPDEDGNTKVFTIAQTPAAFPGGAVGWDTYLEKNLNAKLGAKYIKVPKGLKTAKATVILTFIVNKYDFVSDIAAEGNPPPKLVEEAIRVIEQGPKWIQQNKMAEK